MQKPTVKRLDLEVVEVERRQRDGCINSSSTNPRCTCPPPLLSQIR
jgi:hypothetical protein